METITIPLRPLLVFVVVLSRVGGLVTFAPFWGTRVVPKRVRAAHALALAIVVTPVVGPRIPDPPADVFGLGVVMAGELTIGCLIGLVGQLVFAGLEMAAQVLSIQLGFSLVAIIDPNTSARTTALGTMAQMFGLVVLLAVDGHHWLLTATVRSFYVVGPGGFTASASLAEILLRLSADVLAVGAALAAPAIVVLLAVELSLAVAGRVMPRFEVLLLGFPVKIAVGLWLMGASLYFLPGAVRQVINSIQSHLINVIEAVR